MSLISEALRKVQKDREGHGDKNSSIEARNARKSVGRFELRRILYIIIPLIIVVLIIYITFLSGKQPVTSVRLSGITPVIIKDSGRPDVEKKEKIETKNPLEVQSEKKKSPDRSSTQKEPSVNKLKNPQRNMLNRNIQIKKKIVKTEKSQEGKPDEGVDLIVRASQHLSGKRYFEAVKLYKEILKKKPSENIYLKLYTCYKRLKNEILADYYLKEGLRNFGESFYLNKISAIKHIRGKNYAGAIENIKTALQQGREDYSLNTYLGLSYFHQKMYDSALQQFKKSLSLNINAIENYYYIGLIHDNKRNFDKALEYYGLFLNLNPDNKYFKHKKWIISRVRMLESR